MDQVYTNTLNLLAETLRTDKSQQLFPSGQIHKTAFKSFSEEDWRQIYHECMLHGILLLVFGQIQRFCRTEDIIRKWQMNAMRQFAHGIKLLEEQKELLTLLEGFHPVIIKGAATAVYYPVAESRQMGDIDLVVLGTDVESCKDILGKQGYILGEENRRHISFYKNGILVELHRRNPYTVKQTAWYDRMDYVVTKADKTKEVSISGYKIPVFEDAYNGLIILTHLLHHMAGGIGLRQLIDWRMYAENYLTDENWYNTFRLLVEELDIVVFTKVVTRTCQLYLGLRDDITWCQDIDMEACGQLIQFVMERGNFGNKMNFNNQSMDVLVRSSGIKNFVVNLQRQGTYNWKVLKKCPWLKPFAWFYQGIRYIRRGYEQKISFKDLKRERVLKREMDALFQKMGLE